MLYETRPVRVHAEQFTDEREVHRLGMWCGGVPVYMGVSVVAIELDTVQGKQRADIGDFIIHGTGDNGGFLVCKPEIFHKNYRAVEENGEPAV